ncbi:hypothetical protein BDV97DRAFT_400853 [Delphinella strobiligena]|nr:hypothetical protein BDV97DRAFT_400853 [Delphinella strobiligena]
MSSYDALPMEVFETLIARSLHFNLTRPRLTSKGGIQKISKIRVMRTLPLKRPQRVETTFMGLPGEIRNEIYKHAMDDLPRGLMLYDGQIMLPFHNLQFVSKQISAEIAPFVRFHARNAPMTVCIQNCNFDPFMTWLKGKSTEEQEILQARSWIRPFVMEFVCTINSIDPLLEPLMEYLGPRVYEDPIRDLDIVYTRLDCAEGWIGDEKTECCWGHACLHEPGHPRGLEVMVLLAKVLDRRRDFHKGMVGEMQRLIDGYLGPIDSSLLQLKH